mgnify:CR=1 FL=1
MADRRILSLIASSTETVCALGLEADLVGRSHECDFPPSVERLPICSEPKFDIHGSSLEIDQRVKDALRDALSVYRVHADVLKALQPTHIITQDQCEVCAVSLKDVEAAVCDVLDSSPKIVSLAPNSLEDIYAGILEMATSLGVADRGQNLVRDMQSRLKIIGEQYSTISQKPSVVCVEWIDPFMPAGIWVPELVSMAGGNDLLGIPNKHTPVVPLEKLIEANPDKIVVRPCGWGLKKTRAEMEEALKQTAWQSLRAVQSGELYLTDGNHFFNRPGPRVVESAEILAEIFHPETADYGHKGIGWERY